MQSLATPYRLRLVVDANILVGELLRQRGVDLLRDPRLMLFITTRAWNEVEHELPKWILVYVQRNPNQTLTDEQMYQSLHRVVSHYVTHVEESVYAAYEAKARLHIPHDPDDWPTAALSLAFGIGIWTEDRHFLGRGLATWRTDALRAYLA